MGSGKFEFLPLHTTRKVLSGIEPVKVWFFAEVAVAVISQVSADRRPPPIRKIP